MTSKKIYIIKLIQDGSSFEGIHGTDNHRICFCLNVVHLYNYLGISLPDQYIRLWNIHNQGKCHNTVLWHNGIRSIIIRLVTVS